LAQKKFLTSGISVFNVKIISENERKSQFFAVKTGKRDWVTAELTIFNAEAQRRRERQLQSQNNFTTEVTEGHRGTSKKLRV